ncbi:piggyBac transposable element-derived protein 4-like [Oppia nitens]|uniref:piggyBac transposable element-derived protein 4-like n=1 Tax=Oppia nitens TaxID=1686743 RepID=UPI0023DA3E61|nr:piggyBac transposable element-derived protein 4-like [Oppia nitens]
MSSPSHEPLASEQSLIGSVSTRRVNNNGFAGLSSLEESMCQPTGSVIPPLPQHPQHSLNSFLTGFSSQIISNRNQMPDLMDITGGGTFTNNRSLLRMSNRNSMHTFGVIGDSFDGPPATSLDMPEFPTLTENNSIDELSHLFDEESDNEGINIEFTQTYDNDSDNSEDEDQINNTNQVNEWSFDTQIENNWLPKFERICGPTIDTPTDPTLIFDNYINEDFLSKVVNYTNRYNETVDVTISELKNFIAIQILISLKQIPNERDHWSNGFYGSDIIKRTMSRTRYGLIKSALHFCDENSNNKTDELYKVRMLLSHLTDISQHLYVPTKELSVDESLVAFKGLWKHIQYIPSKAHKFGIKFYVLCESRTGYMINMLCYCGDDTTSSTKHIVLKLMECVGEMSGHTLFCDNYYTSIELAEELASLGVGLTGTLRKNRKGLPLNFHKCALNLSKKNCGPIYMRKDKLCCVAWFDNKQVLALSTHLTKGEVEIERRSRKSLSGIVNIQCPIIINNYNKFMGGVDRYDQRLSYHSYPHRLMKWTLVIWHLFLNVSINNSYIIYKSKVETPMKSSYFKLQIAYRLIGYNTMKTNLHSCGSSHLIKIDAKPTKRNCIMCRKMSIRHQTSYWCSNCKNPLCHEAMSSDATCFQRHVLFQNR